MFREDIWLRNQTDLSPNPHFALSQLSDLRKVIQFLWASASLSADAQEWHRICWPHMRCCWTWSLKGIFWVFVLFVKNSSYQVLLGSGAVGTLTHWWGDCKWCSLVGKRFGGSWNSSVYTCLPCDPAVPLLGKWKYMSTQRLVVHVQAALL